MGLAVIEILSIACGVLYLQTDKAKARLESFNTAVNQQIAFVGFLRYCVHPRPVA